jgi:hypothetical protein
MQRVVGQHAGTHEYREPEDEPPALGFDERGEGSGETGEIDAAGDREPSRG